MKRNFIIFSPPYDENSGGIIVLHKLCHLLNQIGEEAYLWPASQKPALSLFKRLKKKLSKQEYALCADYNTPLAKFSDLKSSSIVVYPEIINGNPLKAKNVVRWLLHKPGFHTGVAEFSESELFFSYDENCYEPGYGIDISNILTVVAINPAYAFDDNPSRSGSCYMLRKGKGRDITHDDENSLFIDDLEHDEVASVFKQKKYFYCYDEYTFFSQYAALCGCISVVMPAGDKSKEEWVENHPISKYGIAYGVDDIEHAIKTMDKVGDYFKELEQNSILSTKSFVDKSSKHFSL